MSIQTCLVKMKQYLKESGLEKNVNDSRLREFARQLEASGGDALTPKEFKSKAQAMIDNETKRWYAKKQAQDLMILAKREAALSSLVENYKNWKDLISKGQAGNPEDMPVQAFRAWLEGGSLRPGLESNLSVEKMSKAIQAQLQDVFNEAVRPVKDAAASGQIDRDTMQELDAIDRKLPLMQSRNESALEYAKAIKATRDKIFQLKQANNPFMEAASEYLLKQFHDRARITADPSEAGKQAWLDQAMKTYGDKSFPEATLDEKQKIFKDIYDRISDGRWGSVTDDSASDKYLTVNGTGGNISRRMSQARQLIAKDWQAAYEYNSKYGPKTIAEGMDKVMSSASRDISILSKFGPNPQGMYEGLFQRFLSKLSGPDAESFEASKPTLDKRFDIVSGSQNAPARGTVAKFVQGTMTAQYLAKTGAAAVRSLPDLALAGSLLRDLNGDTVFTNAARLAGEYAKGLGSSSYANDRLQDVGLFAKAAHAELMRTLGSPDSSPGTMGKIAEGLGSLNILNRHVDAMRSAMGTVLTKLLGDVSDLKYENLPGSWQRGLGRYGIDENAWNVMRLAKDDLSGRTSLTPESVGRLPDVAVENYMRKSGQFSGDEISKQMLDYGRSQLALKLGTMINEHADLGSAHPDTRQRSFLWGDTNINQGWGMLARLMTQFKTAALVSSDVYRRGYFSGSSPKGDFYGIAQHMILGGFLWTLGEYANQLASGKTPEDPTTPEFGMKMVAGSGFAGVYGDVLLNEMQRQGVQDKMLAASNAIIGPVLGTGVEGAAIGLQAGMQSLGEEKSQRNLGSKAMNLFLGNVPGQNLFYTKAAFNYYIANGLKEFLGPGYLSYLERKTSQTPALGGGNQQYLFGRPTAQSFLGE